MVEGTRRQQQCYTYHDMRKPGTAVKLKKIEQIRSASSGAEYASPHAEFDRSYVSHVIQQQT